MTSFPAGTGRPARSRRGARIVAVLAACLLFPPPAAPAAVRPAPSARHAMVVAADPAAAEAALSVLKAGGNAVDAAVAAGFALAVTYPRAGNIGGGGFLLARMADGRSFVVDYRETAPAAARKEMFLDASGHVVEGLSTDSYLATGVPGTVAGLAKAREIAGTLPWPRLLAPAIALAESGFETPAGLSASIARYADRLRSHAPAAAVFLPAGAPPAPGSLFVQKDLARTLRVLADDGPRAFYEGPIAEAIAAQMKDEGGLVTLEDLAGYEPVVREPIAIDYRGRRILAPPLPSSGGIVLAEMLHMLEPHDLAALGPGSSACLHLLTEVMKRAYADRAAFLGDSDQISVPVEGLLSRDYAVDLMKSFDPERATPAPQAGPGRPAPREHEATTHFSIVDEAGNVVSNTYTLNGSYGTGAVVEGWGFLLNNEMDDFSVRPGVPNMYGLVGGEANAVAPRKRMLSSMTPVIVLEEGKPVLAFGTPGGSRIITMVLQVLTGVVDFGMELQEAVDHPRCHHQWSPDKLWCERGFLAADVMEGLKRRGHVVVESGEWGEVDAIQIDPASGIRRGAADARGYGAAVGY